MRGFLVFSAVGTLLVLGACTPSDKYPAVAQGAKGATSPAETGRLGVFNEVNTPGETPKADTEHEIKPIAGPVTNGWDDDTMEGSGNIAGQGIDAHPAATPDTKAPTKAFQ